MCCGVRRECRSVGLDITDTVKLTSKSFLASRLIAREFNSPVDCSRTPYNMSVWSPPLDPL
eukprot:8359643-Pyramimonas_sp.AAC.1